MRFNFSQEQINDRMNFENPWWETGKVEDFYTSMKKREYFKLIYPLITEKKVKRALVLMGPRRVGKTVILFHAIQNLIEDGVPPKNICYLSVETPIYNGIALEELLQNYLALSTNKGKNNVYVIFDEVQYLKDWEVHLKSLVDSYHNIKFIVSGSAAAALKLKSNESGAGRFTDFILPPLTFHEYLSLTGNETLVAKPIMRKFNDDEHETMLYDCPDINLLNKEFIRYINFGGYPEVSLSPNIQADPGRYIRNDIIDKVLLRDLPLLYGIEDIQELNSLFTYIAYHTGSEMSLDTISQSSGVSKNTIKKYITYLEAAFLIKVIKRINDSGKKFKRDNFFKIYLTNPSLRCALFSPVDEDDPAIGNLVETAIFAQWQHAEEPLYYARWNQGEVDIVHLEKSTQKPEWVIEIKWSDKPATDPSHRDLRNLKLFCNNNNLSVATITTYSIDKEEKLGELDCHFTPSSLYCYTVGRNLIIGKSVLGHLKKNN